MGLNVSYESIVHYIQVAFDIIIVWLLISFIIRVAKANQKTIQIFQGVVLILLIQAVAQLFGLSTLAFITNNIVSWGFLAIIVVFQPEIRSILERLGKSNALASISVLSNSEKETLIDELVEATANLSASKTGALITLEQSYSLTEYIKTGVKLNSSVSAELLCSIFQTTTPLHDGAIIIQGDKIACASAYFPPTTVELPSRYGARHRAAIGISEVSDAVTIVVSEESGRVAVTDGGKIIQMNESKLRAYLEKVILNKENVTKVQTRVVNSESVDVEKLIKETANDAEIDFREDSKGNKLMKTFQSSDFKKEVEEAEKQYIEKKQATSVKPVFKDTIAGNAIKKVVKDIAESREKKEAADKSSVKIKTVSVGSSEMVEVGASSGEEPIETTAVVDGSAAQGGENNG